MTCEKSISHPDPACLMGVNIELRDSLGHLAIFITHWRNEENPIQLDPKMWPEIRDFIDEQLKLYVRSGSNGDA